MGILILVAVIALVFGIAELGIIPPFHATKLVRMRRGAAFVEKGNLRGNEAEHIESILRDAGVADGFVAVAGQRVYFSWQIPKDVHQRLRNVLLNQWR